MESIALYLPSLYSTLHLYISSCIDLVICFCFVHLHIELISHKCIAYTSILIKILLDLISYICYLFLSYFIYLFLYTVYQSAGKLPSRRQQTPSDPNLMYSQLVTSYITQIHHRNDISEYLKFSQNSTCQL